MPPTPQVMPDLIERLPRQLRLRELRVFVTVLEHRSFRKAAVALHVTQPAVTKSIAGLEALLGVKLFDRVANGVEPTVHGMAFASRARAIFGELRSAAQELDIVSRGASGTLQIGTVPLPAAGLLPIAIGRLLKRHPNVFVTIVEARERELADMLRRRAIDVAFVRLAQFPAADDLRSEALFEQTLCVLASRTHRLASRLRLTWKEIEREQWVLPPQDSPFLQQVRRALDRADLPLPRNCVESASITIQYGMVLHGSMLSFGLRNHAVMPQVKDVLVRLPVDLPAVTGTFGTVTLRNREERPVATHLLEEIRAITTATD